jgi:hypothetical protein
VQLLLNFLELPHQVKLRLGAPQVKDSVLVRRRDDTVEASFLKYFYLYRGGKTLCVRC